MEKIRNYEKNSLKTGKIPIKKGKILLNGKKNPKKRENQEKNLKFN